MLVNMRLFCILGMHKYRFINSYSIRNIEYTVYECKHCNKRLVVNK